MLTAFSGDYTCNVSCLPSARGSSCSQRCARSISMGWARCRSWGRTSRATPRWRARCWRAAGLDVVLTATVAASLACFYVSEVERDEGRRRWLLAGFYACTGLSLLAKGLVGVIIPAGVVVVYFLLRRRWPGLGRLGVWWGSLLMLAVAATWYAPVVARHGRVFVDEFIVRQHFARYVSDKYHHAQPFYFYLPVMLLLALPWTLFLLNGLAATGETNARAED